MAIHMSIRLAWHSEGWNGHICKKPCENSYCIGQHSYPGSQIAESRDIQFETEHAGEPCSKYPCKTACGLSVNAFGNDTVAVGVAPPAFIKPGDADAITISLPPSTACTWCYEAMYSDEVKAGPGSRQMYDYTKRKELSDQYFAQFEPGKSLIFYYAGYSNPFCENEENNFVVVGISRVKKIDYTYFYENVSDAVKKKYAGGFVWQKPITSNFPDEGFCIPYWKYMDNENVLNRLVLKPQNRNPFKYGSREVDNDDAIEVVNQLLSVVDTLVEIEDDTEDWTKRKDWLNSVLNELWTARGPYPGFASVMESLGLHSLVSSYIGLTTDDSMKAFREDVRALLAGEVDKVNDITFPKAKLNKLRREYELLGDETADFLFETLSRFDLKAEQVEKIISADRSNKVSITASIEEMQENPYIIFEQYSGKDNDDVIPFYKIDNGVIPSPEYGVDELLDNGSTERLRAFCVDELNRIAAHSFAKAELVLKAVNARIERLPEWKRYVYRMKNFDVQKDILDCALVQKKDDKGTLFLYLKEVYEDERIVEKVLSDLAARPDMQLRMAITREKFKKGLRVEGSPLNTEAPEQYDEILDHQAEICMKIFAKPLCILSGAAGTGKTTVIRTILENIDRVHGAGTSYLLMAPTGKAADRINTQTGKTSSTIHSQLARYGWLNENMTLKRSGGETSADVNTIIIDECSMIDLNLFATLMRSINWNSVQRLILIGDPNQLPPIGRGKVFADTIDWLKQEYPDCVGTLTDNIRQLVNQVMGNGRGILDLAEVFIQEHVQMDDSDEAAKLKAKRENLFEQIVENGNGDVQKDLGVYFWNEQEELESLLKNVMVRDMQEYTNLKVGEGNVTINKLWHQMIRKPDGSSNPEVMQVISPYRGEYYGTDSINQFLQKTLNTPWVEKKLNGVGYFDKVIQFRNRPQSDLAYAMDDAGKNVHAEIFNGEIGLTKIYPDDKERDKNGEFIFRSQPKIDRLQVSFSGEKREGLAYNYGSNIGRDEKGKWIPEQKVLDNLELAYAISVHKSQGSEFDYVYIVIPHKDSHLLSMELLYTAITRAQKKVTIFLQQDVSTLTTMSHPEKSAVRKINSSVFKFEPIADEVLYTKGKWYESGKKIATLSKYFVRSKSEAIITNLLVDRDIPFKYEEPLYAPDGTMFLPDFTVTFRGEEYYWEHVGRTNDPKYMVHWAKKEEWYQKNFPGKLLTTFEGNDLTTDAVAIIEKYV